VKKLNKIILSILLLVTASLVISGCELDPQNAPSDLDRDNSFGGGGGNGVTYDGFLNILNSCILLKIHSSYAEDPNLGRTMSCDDLCDSFIGNEEDIYICIGGSLLEGWPVDHLEHIECGASWHVNYGDEGPDYRLVECVCCSP